ncbi:hypothetical protein [Saccharothrix coeruleofusca]|uniref:Uncharacterized protein n=1 Tax=Saccharothrix coeruleofusca TaxID=33919 RepID=A0A918ARX0_9PSEU|nr:hypothetical protein [Saccharothrix coeruleofusca]MBP2335348.1 hypothetical protein [Saccharothrix coeruleofusca]GGP77274.1 hypothetical protein GCM10010185_58660 [Saccharothrix coeruleofusca]
MSDPRPEEQLPPEGEFEWEPAAPWGQPPAGGAYRGWESDGALPGYGAPLVAEVEGPDPEISDKRPESL